MSKVAVDHPLVYIVLLNYQHAEETLACLESLRSLEYPNYKIIVVDNGSEEKHVRKLKKAWQTQDFHFITSKENLGYSGGYNLAIQSLLDDEDVDPLSTSVWLLNNDTTVEPNALGFMMEKAQKTGGLVGSLLLYPDRTYQQVGTRINWTTGSTKGYPESALADGMEVECLTGASMLVPLRVFRHIGLLDESYFLYFEDAEFSLRAASKNYPLTLAIRARVYHKEGATTGRKSRLTQYYYYRNRMRVLSQYAVGIEKMTIGLYSYLRLARSYIKALLSSSEEKRISHAIHWLAMQDFYKGVSGPCPHNLENL